MPRDDDERRSGLISEAKAEMFKALGHPARIRILEILVDGEHSVSELQPLVGIEAPHLSQQLGVLRRAGLVTTRKEGTSVIYAIRDDELVTVLAASRRFLMNSLTEAQGLLAEMRATTGRR